MQELIRQYGRLMVYLSGAAALLTLLFMTLYGSGVYRKLAEQLKNTDSSYTSHGQKAAKQIFQQESLKVQPKMNLSSGQTYRVKELVKAKKTGLHDPVGGKAIQVLQIYDAPENRYETTDVSEYSLIQNGQKVIFLRRGLYKLFVSLRDQNHHSAMQYIFISIET